VSALRIFVAHPSGFLTDCKANGDGLVAYGFLEQLGRRGHEIHVAVERAEIAQPLPANVVLHHIGDNGRTPRPVFMARMRMLFDRVRRKTQFDVIHQLNPVFSGMSLALAGTPVPIVLGTYIGEWPERRAAGLRGRLRQSLSSNVKRGIVALQQSQAQALLVTTPAALSRVPQATRLVDRIYMLPNGIDTNHFSPSAEQDRERAIVSLCGLAERKGAQILLDAFGIVARSFPDVVLRIGGGAAAEDIARARAHLGDVAARVSFVGPVSRSSLPEFLRSGSVFCMPSLGEPYGMAALEAMAVGLPIVCSDGGGLTHLVADGGGIRIREGSVEECATALLAMLSDGDARRRFGTFNRKRALEEFAWPKVIERLESVYLRVMEGCKRRS